MASIEREASLEASSYNDEMNPEIVEDEGGECSVTKCPSTTHIERPLLMNKAPTTKNKVCSKTRSTTKTYTPYAKLPTV